MATMTNQSLARINNLISKHITLLEANNLLSFEDKANIAEIIVYLANSLAALKFVGEGSEGEGWKDGDS